MRGEFQALSLAAGKCGGGLAKPQIAETDLIQDAKLGDNLGDASEKRECFARGKLQNFVDVFAAITDIEHAGFETRAAALFADQFDIGEKLHFHRDRAIALTRLAAPAGDVE